MANKCMIHSITYQANGDNSNGPLCVVRACQQHMPHTRRVAAAYHDKHTKHRHRTCIQIMQYNVECTMTTCVSTNASSDGLLYAIFAAALVRALPMWALRMATDTMEWQS